MSERETLDDLEYGVAQGRYTATQVFEKMRARVEEVRAALSVCQLELAGERGRAALATDALDPRTLNADVLACKIESLACYEDRDDMRRALQSVANDIRALAQTAPEQPEAGADGAWNPFAARDAYVNEQRRKQADGQAEPVAWRRATKHGWEYRQSAPTAKTRGNGWMPLYTHPTPQADKREAMQTVRETLHGIVSADWRKWEELASPEEFERWAKARAAHALHALSAQPAPGAVDKDALLIRSYHLMRELCTYVPRADPPFQGVVDLCKDIARALPNAKDNKKGGDADDATADR